MTNKHYFLRSYFHKGNEKPAFLEMDEESLAAFAHLLITEQRKIK